MAMSIDMRNHVHFGSVKGMYFDLIHGSVRGYERAYHEYLAS
jgi:hypothetical protein